MRPMNAEEAEYIVSRIRENPWLFAANFPPMEDFRFAEEWMDAVETITMAEMILGPGLTAEQIAELRARALN